MRISDWSSYVCSSDLLRDSGTAKSKSKGKSTPHVQLLGSGTILREVIAAAELLDKDFGVSADIWSCPSFNELARDGADALRHNRQIGRASCRERGCQYV